MTFMAPNKTRGLMGFAGIILMVVGAGVVWGWGMATFIGGLYLVIETSSDEVIERFTGITRWKDEA